VLCVILFQGKGVYARIARLRFPAENKKTVGQGVDETSWGSGCSSYFTEKVSARPALPLVLMSDPLSYSTLFPPAMNLIPFRKMSRGDDNFSDTSVYGPEPSHGGGEVYDSRRRRM
jgi:hypothetical protein